MYYLDANDFSTVSHLTAAAFRTTNSDVERHGHAFLELVLVVEGRAQHRLYEPQSDSPHIYEVRANDLFLIPVGWSHAYQKTENFYIYNILFYPSLLESLLSNCEASSRAFEIFSGIEASNSDELVHKIHLRTGERELIEACVREVSREITLRRSGFELIAQAKMIEALVLVARVASARANGNAAMTLLETGSPVANAAAFMEERFSDAITLDDIASAAHLNPTYLCEVFKATFGMSVGTYLSQLRLEHARFLLSTTQMSITDIADRTGFVHAGYFARVFKASTGQTPREFRSKSNVFKGDLKT